MFHGERRVRRDREDFLTELIRGGLAELGLDAGGAEIGRLAELCRLLAAWARRINLSAHREPEEIARRLVLDAAALLRELPEVASLADVGSGAGFPGLPIAVLRPAWTVTLIESRERPHHFHRAAVRALGLGNVAPLLGRAEKLAGRPHGAVVAQAVAAPGEALSRMLPWAAPGALLILPGSEAGAEPLATLDVPDGVEGAAAIRSYRVPFGGPRRTVWLGRRGLE